MGCCGSSEAPLPLDFHLFDERTFLPTIIIELRQAGYVEVCGKNHANIHSRLGGFLEKKWGCSKFDWGDSVPYCDAKFSVPSGVLANRGGEMENNMGLRTMELVEFVTSELGWTLCLSNGGGAGHLRETQIKFAAPNPLNLVASYVLIELRTAGYIEINGKDQEGVYEALGEFLKTKWDATPFDWGGKEPWCALKFKTPALRTRGGEGENNVGEKTMELADFMTRELGWTMLTCDGGTVAHLREQQMIFQLDAKKAASRTSSSNLMVELRQVGYVEINGRDTDGIYSHLDMFLKDTWSCSEWNWSGKTPFCTKKYKCGAFRQRGGEFENNLGLRAMELIESMQSRGWSLLLIGGGSFGPYREAQIKFQSPDPVRPPQPILIVELRALGYIEVNGQDTAGVYSKLHEFFTKQLQCTVYEGDKWCAVKYRCPVGSHGVFRSRGGQGENDIGMITMRIADYLVDHVGGWDLVACLGQNLGEGFGIREQMIVFRYVGGARRPLPRFNGQDLKLEGPVEGISFPQKWTLIDRGLVTAGPVHQTGRASQQERVLLQELIDQTFKRVKTRDRTGGIPARLEIVSVVVSEHVELYRRYFLARAAVPNAPITETWRPKTSSEKLHAWAQLDSAANEAYLMHGTTPASALSILSSGFSVDLAGASVGTMFGAGAYLAECSSKADEYARGDDLQPDICALLVCRVVIGRCFMTTEPGDYASVQNVESIIGDREVAVGTYREFVIRAASHIYPEYAVLYRRVWEADGAPPPQTRMGSEAELPPPESQ